MLPNHLAAVYVVKPQFMAELCSELDDKNLVTLEDLVFSEQEKLNVCFALDIWLEPQVITFKSISEAAKILRQAGKYWYLHPLQQLGRSRLIAEQLYKLPSLTRPFPPETAIPTIGGFCLLDQHTLIYSVKRVKQWPAGQCYFIEDKFNPPNRAYLKLWEAFTLLDKYPKTGDRAVDLGASPGGWTYVLHALGAQVTAVDKAPLAPKIAALPGVECVQQSAFALDPNSLSHEYDWVLSDIACYPERAYQLILAWIKAKKAKQMIFTIKLQGKIEQSTLNLFREIPNSQLLHLFYNKHEVTFFYPAIKTAEVAK